MDTLNLKTMLESLDREALIKVGAIEGSSYFYCGTAGGFLDKIDEYSEQALEYFKKQLKPIRERYNHSRKVRPLRPLSIGKDEIDDILKYPAKDMFSPQEEAKYLETRRYMNDLLRWSESIHKKRQTIDVLTEIINEFKPFGERYLKDAFFSHGDEDRNDILVLQIEGYESGNYWLLKEAKCKSPFSLKIMSTFRPKSEEEEEDEE